MSVEEFAIPAGWYPSPDGLGERFWDGNGWTLQARVSAATPTATTVMDPVVAGVVPLSQPTPPPTGPPPGWYPDPSGVPYQRWFDGRTWTDHTQSGGGPAMMSTTTVIMGNQKSVGVAFLLAFFFGPLGLLYATVTGGLIMLGVNFCLLILGFVTLGLGWALFWFSWFACVIWACVAASSANNRPQVYNHQMMR